MSETSPLGTPPSRREYIAGQKAKGRRIVGVFPAQYPREILWAMNALPVEIWDPPLEVTSAGAHMQTYICPVVMLGLELVLQGHAGEVDAFLFPHTCDSIQNMASVVHDYLGINKPCFFFYHPKAPYRDSARVYYRRQIKSLAERLAKVLGPLEWDRLKAALEQGRRLNKLMERLYAARAKGLLDISNRQFYRELRLVEYLYPEDLLPRLEALLETRLRAEPDGKPTVVLSGVLPNPPEILDVLDDQGVRVGGDDLLSMGRRLLIPFGESADPWEALTDSYLKMPPCSSKNSSIADRLAWIGGLVEQCGARGVIFNLVKFCEPELFDVPQLVEGLKKRGLATLVMDNELNQGLSGQLATRVEAMVEMMR